MEESNGSDLEDKLAELKKTQQEINIFQFSVRRAHRAIRLAGQGIDRTAVEGACDPKIKYLHNTWKCMGLASETARSESNRWGRL